MKILLPVDGSAYTQRALEYLARRDDLVGNRNAEFTLLTVVPSIPAYAARMLGGQSLDDYYREQAEEVLAPMRERIAGHGWNVRYAHATGSAAVAIAARAEADGSDLIVMGTHGYSALGNMVLGSVASGVLARCKVPVLLIR